MKKKIPYIILAIVLILAVVMAVLYVKTGDQIFDQFTKIETREKTIENRKEYIENFENFAKDFEREDILIDSQLGDHKIPGIILRKPENTKYAVLAHGMGGTKESMFPQMRILLEEGYNCLTLDMRQSGENEAEYNTGGVLEAYDVIDGINYVKEITDLPVLVFGESFGGAAVLQAFTKEPNLFGYIILDCPVADGRHYLYKIADEMNAPRDFFIAAGDRVYKKKLGFSLNDMDSISKLKNNIHKNVHVPVLVLNARLDAVTPYSMGEGIYNAIPYEEKMIFTSEIAQHAQIVNLEPEAYKNAITNFLEKFEK